MKLRGACGYADRFEELIASIEESPKQDVNEEMMVDSYYKEAIDVLNNCHTYLENFQLPREEFALDVQSKLAIIGDNLRKCKAMVF